MVDHAQILDHLSIGAAVIDPDLRIVFWNRWMAEHSQLDRPAVLGRRIHEILPVLADNCFVEKARESFRRGQPGFFNKKLHRNIFPFYSGRSYIEKRLAAMEQTVILTPLTDAQGRTVQLMISVFDISDWIANQNELLRSRNELQRLSRTDELTQAPNRRSIMERLAEELALHRRKKRPMSLALLDIDHFKKINDNYGHQVGDIILEEMVRLVCGRMRDYDALGRYGGEEFLLVLPETTREKAFLACDRLRLAVQAEEFKAKGQGHRITVSLGVACKDEAENPTLESLIKEADRCLYRAKESGRNRTEIARTA